MDMGAVAPNIDKVVFYRSAVVPILFTILIKMMPKLCFLFVFYSDLIHKFILGFYIYHVYLRYMYFHYRQFYLPL